jgi:hypothetical protein
MQNTRKNSAVGDNRSPALMATENGLRIGAEQAGQIQADKSLPASECSALGELANTKPSSFEKPKMFSCMQTLWILVFFDGTGNNLDADLDFLKHSNIAKLYQVSKEDERAGIYSIYIPGVATLFPPIGDDGGSIAGKVAGEMGEARINYALKQMEQKMRRHLALAQAPSNAIIEINLAVFGFGRGAALARAFVNKLFETRCRVNKGKFTLANGNWPVRIRFMGLFDTVASVGKPVSSTTTDIWAAARSNVASMIEDRLDDYETTRPQALAFSERGVAGADPTAPSTSHGHNSYGSKLMINEAVEEVRHFVAAHEMRNSFPVESISVFKNGRMVKPGHFYETVYPGVHSDVGGSYAPQEGGKSPRPKEKFGVIPLVHMYQYAIRAGVPLLNPGGWSEMNHDDFSADRKLMDSYDYYLKMISAPGTLGAVMNNHMQHYYAWRFRAIRLKGAGDKSESIEIAAATSKFIAANGPIDSKLATLNANIRTASMRMTDLENEIRDHQIDGDNAWSKANVIRLKANLAQAKTKHETARQEMLKEKARKDSLPDMKNFQSLVDLYDRQLVRDAEAILAVLTQRPRRPDSRPPFTRADLRPHYRVLVEAYEAEFIHNKGLTDKIIIHFFDEYIHDSLSGFGADATIPSDPRVVYVGGNEKLLYAGKENDANDRQMAGST